ncbi:putative transcription factor C2H2 family [Dioscorea sansibarensis]
MISSMAVTPLSTNSTDLVEEEAMADERAQPEASPAPSLASAPAPAPPKQERGSAVRHVGSRIYDRENGISCHQCRQKTRDFAVSCKKMKKKNKPCCIRFCHKCLRNRYGENALEAYAKENWECPKCRGICNCSVCMKRRGQRPTGMLIHAAKATGYSSVSEWLHHNIAEGSNAGNMEAVPAEASRAKEIDNVGEDRTEDPQPEMKNNADSGNEANRENTYNVTCPASEENASAENDNTAQPMPVKIRRPRKRDIISTAELEKKAIVLPEGSPLMMVADVEWQAEDAGPVLQFLEFCSTFSKILDIRKGQPEAILREIASECVTRRGSQPLTVQFQIKLLSLIKEGRGEGSTSYSPDNACSWLQDLGNVITESPCIAKELQLGFYDWVSIDYDDLEPSEKLKILNFLCDETLGTEVLRSWIDEENTKFLEQKKEDRGKASAVKQKEKDIKQKMKDEMAKAMAPREGAPLSASEHLELISKIKTEAEKSSAELAESMEVVPKKKRRMDAVRTECVFIVENERTYWKLGGSGSSDILAQEIENQDLVKGKDKWFSYDEDSRKVIEKVISTLRYIFPCVCQK